MPIADVSAERPPLAPELWNFAVVLVICAILAWMLRLLRLLLVVIDMRYALYAQAVCTCVGYSPGHPFTQLHCLIDAASPWSWPQVRPLALLLIGM